MEITKRIVVDFKHDGERAYFNILLPEGEKTTTDEMAKILSGALALCIRSSKNESELMSQIIEYLNEEYVNINSFSDRKIIPHE
jgi:hypothetical protein